jgi:signal transduction histidine kinase
MTGSAGLSLSIEELPDAVLLLDADGDVLAANALAVRLCAAGDPVGCSVHDVLPLRDARGTDWWSCTAASRRLPGVTRAPEQLLTCGERSLLVSARYVRDEGRLHHTVLAVRDTAARQRQERSAADLVSTVAHELRSPLTSVKGFTATLLAKWDRFTDEQKQIMLQTVNADADRVTRLISELLDVSRIDSGRLELHRQVVDVAGAVRKACQGHIAAGEPADRFVLQEHGTPPEMWLDPDKLDQIVGNLVENALRHGDGTVTVVLQATDAGVEVTVTDEGEGVDEDIQSMIFGKFWRGRRRRGGTGLGLYITKGLVEAHGGRIEVGGALSGGAQFRFTLPAGTPSFM